VASQDSDCGLGIYSASSMMDLDFIPIGDEEYDIAIPYQYLEFDMVKELLEILNSREFKDELDRLGGYDYKDIGKVIII
jgi:putative molybdopterin biosynthesis protein